MNYTVFACTKDDQQLCRTVGFTISRFIPSSLMVVLLVDCSAMLRQQ